MSTRCNNINIKRRNIRTNEGWVESWKRKVGVIADSLHQTSVWLVDIRSNFVWREWSQAINNISASSQSGTITTNCVSGSFRFRQRWISSALLTVEFRTFQIHLHVMPSVRSSVRFLAAGLPFFCSSGFDQCTLFDLHPWLPFSLPVCNSLSSVRFNLSPWRRALNGDEWRNRQHVPIHTDWLERTGTGCDNCTAIGIVLCEFTVGDHVYHSLELIGFDACWLTFPSSERLLAAAPCGSAVSTRDHGSPNDGGAYQVIMTAAPDYEIRRHIYSPACLGGQTSVCWWDARWSQCRAYRSL